MSHDEVEDAMDERKQEQAAHSEDILDEVRDDLGDQTYPTSSEELSAHYADGPLDLPNETESVGSVFRRLDDSYEDAEAAYEAFQSEFESEAQPPGAADAEANATWSEERADDSRPPADEE